MRAAEKMQFSDHKEVETVLLDSTPPATARAVCQYAASPALEGFDDVCNLPGSKPVAISDSSAPVDLGLDSMLTGSGFQFYGNPIGKIWVSKDGYISFTKDNPDPNGVLTPGALDRYVTGMGAAPPLQSVMVFWDTLSFWDAMKRAVGKVCYVLEGDGDNRRFRVTWEHACVTQPCTPPDNLNFTIALEERTHRVVLTYGAMIAGNPDRAQGINATVGLVHDAIGCPADECKLATGLCKDGVTPCGYSQVFTDTKQTPQPPDMQFVPIANR